MTIRNQGFYDLNSLRPYPLDDSATCIDDAGVLMPYDLIVDLQLLFPDILGRFAYISAVTVTKSLVTVTILASGNPAVLPGCVHPYSSYGPLAPIAAISLPQPVTPGRGYWLESLYPGAGGVIVFGDGVQTPYSGRFSTAAQSMLNSKVAQPRRGLPISGIGKVASSQPLTGLVLLKGGNDVEVVAATRDVANVARQVIVVRLKDTSVAGAGRNVFDIYKGPCGNRPETGTCPDPQPIEFIGSVGPDCCGNITLEFKGCAQASQVMNGCSVILDCDFGLSQACAGPQQLPINGKLPNEYLDECGGFSYVSHVLHASSQHTYPQVSLLCMSSELLINTGLLPHLERFNQQQAADFLLRQGTFDFINDDSPDEPLNVGTPGPGNLINPNYAYRTADAAQACLSTWEVSDPHWKSGNKAVMTSFKATRGPFGALHNAGVVVNYQTTGTPAEPSYFVVEANWDGYMVGNKMLRIAQVVNGDYRTKTWVQAPDLTIDDWYHLDVTTQRLTIAGRRFIRIRGVLRQVGYPAELAVVQYDSPTIEYGSEAGMFGLQAVRAVTEFSWFEVSDYCNGDMVRVIYIGVRDGLALQTLAEYAATRMRQLQDMLALNDGSIDVGVVRAWIVLLQDNLALGDPHVNVKTDVWRLLVMDFLAMQADPALVQPIVTWAISIVDNLALADAVTMFDGIWMVRLTDNLALQDNVAWAYIFNRQLTDNLALSDPVIKTKLGNHYYLQITDGLGVATPVEFTPPAYVNPRPLNFTCFDQGNYGVGPVDGGWPDSATMGQWTGCAVILGGVNFGFYTGIGNLCDIYPGDGSFKSNSCSNPVASVGPPEYQLWTSVNTQPYVLQFMFVTETMLVTSTGLRPFSPAGQANWLYDGNWYSDPPAGYATFQQSVGDGTVTQSTQLGGTYYASLLSDTQNHIYAFGGAALAYFDQPTVASLPCQHESPYCSYINTQMAKISVASNCLYSFSFSPVPTPRYLAMAVSQGLTKGYAGAGQVNPSQPLLYTNIFETISETVDLLNYSTSTWSALTGQFLGNPQLGGGALSLPGQRGYFNYYGFDPASYVYGAPPFGWQYPCNPTDKMFLTGADPGASATGCLWVAKYRYTDRINYATDTISSANQLQPTVLTGANFSWLNNSLSNSVSKGYLSAENVAPYTFDFATETYTSHAWPNSYSEGGSCAASSVGTRGYIFGGTCASFGSTTNHISKIDYGSETQSLADSSLPWMTLANAGAGSSNSV